MTALASARELATLPLDRIRPPALDARIDRDPEKLEELARDLLRRGQIEPIKVFLDGDVYEIIDGFRRYLASKSAGLSTIEAFVYPTRELAHEGIKYATGAYREDFSPADEAKYFYELYTNECAMDLEKVCALVGKKLPYVQDRLALLDGDELVFDALRAKKIGVTVAKELNKCGDATYRRYFLRHAIDGGATSTAVMGWVQQWRTSIGDVPASAPSPELPSASAGVSTAFDPMRCYICGKSDHRIPEQLSVHTSCREAILDEILGRNRTAAE
jgi:ParB family chromosome partitioning protein